MSTDDFSRFIAFNPLSALIPGEDVAFSIEQENRIVLDRIDEVAKEIVAQRKTNLVRFADLCLIGRQRTLFVASQRGG